MSADPQTPFARFLYDSFAAYRFSNKGASITEPMWIEMVDRWHGEWHKAQRRTALPPISPDCHRLYAAYPRKVGKAAALKAIAKALKSAPLEKVEAAVNRFKFSTDRWKRTDREFIPHPATWFNEARWEDDPSEWERGGPPRAAQPAPEPEPKGWLEYMLSAFPGWIKFSDGSRPTWDSLDQSTRTVVIESMRAKA